MLVMGMGRKVTMMGCVVPANEKLILLRQPVVAVEEELLTLPLLRYTKGTAIVQKNDDP